MVPLLIRAQRSPDHRSRRRPGRDITNPTIITDALNCGRIPETAALREVLLCQPTRWHRGKCCNIPETKKTTQTLMRNSGSGAADFPVDPAATTHQSRVPSVGTATGIDTPSTPPSQTPFMQHYTAFRTSIRGTFAIGRRRNSSTIFVVALRCLRAPLVAATHVHVSPVTRSGTAVSSPPPPHLSATLTHLPLFLRRSAPLLHRPPPLCPICLQQPPQLLDPSLHWFSLSTCNTNTYTACTRPHALDRSPSIQETENITHHAPPDAPPLPLPQHTHRCTHLHLVMNQR